MGSDDGAKISDARHPMKPFLAWALLAFAIGGCAATPPPMTAQAEPPPGPEYQAALHALIDCGLRQIARLDDGRSDAGIVARAAAARCDREKTGLQVAAINRAATPRSAHGVDAAIDDAMESTFAAIVLEVRAYRREHRGRPGPSRPPPDATAL